MATDKPGRQGPVNRTDLVTAALLLVLCAGLYYLTTGFEEVSGLFAQDVPPEFFPRLLIGLIALLSLLLPFERFLFGNGEALAKAHAKPIGLMAWLTIGLMVLLVVMIPWLGTYLTLVAVCILLPILWGERRAWVILPYALAFPTGIMILFAQVLKVYFEPGVFNIDFR